MAQKFWLGILAYVLPSFPLAYGWHLTVFAQNYATLNLLRTDPILPMGFATMIVQGAIFSWAYPRMFSTARGDWLKNGLCAAAVFGLLAWSYSVLATAAKIHMASVPDFLQLESGWTILQFAITMPLLALVWRQEA
jgi:hypothetical protein